MTDDLLKDVIKLASKYDIAHLVALGIMNNGLANEETEPQFQRLTFHAVYRYERLNYEFDQICAALENARIPFIPLKGSVLRKYYPEPWMHTSCDIDILVHSEDLDRASNAIDVLKSVWSNVSVHQESSYRYDMTDEFFYFYHIAHMAKHFETGGCGVRPFVDLWILDHIDEANVVKRDELLEKGGLLNGGGMEKETTK